MIKILLCLVVVIFSGLAGWSKASVYTRRVRALTDLTANLKYLESEMGYRMEALPVLFARIGENRRESGGAFFTETARLLETREADTLWSAWVQSVDQVYGADVLLPEDRRIIEELGYELGRTDMETQRSLFSHCYEGLARQADAAREQARVRGRMYRTLGISAGILTAILFI